MRCDSHIHVVGPPERYPQVPNRTYLAGLATLADIERVAAARDVRRFVIVQPSFYGIDNLLLLHTLDALGGRGRGVAVIDPGTLRTRELLDYAARGVRGLRINLYSPLGEKTPLQELFKAIETLARHLEWHIDVIAPLKILAQQGALLARSTVPVVIITGSTRASRRIAARGSSSSSSSPYRTSGSNCQRCIAAVTIGWRRGPIRSGWRSS
jgi:predicted TIM-barrel fold metal-dependent hydrolase